MPKKLEERMNEFGYVRLISLSPNPKEPERPIDKVFDALNGIVRVVMHFKGYPDSSERVLEREDFYVRERDLKPAREALKNRRYDLDI